MKPLYAACALALFSHPAFAFELYHCAVNNVTDGTFGTVDFKVDGNAVTGTSTVDGRGVDVFGYFYAGRDGRQTVTISYQEGRELTESLTFVLPDVVSKLGNATRTTTKEGFGSFDKPVQMICDIATPI
jgi:hypothetical protein